MKPRYLLALDQGTTSSRAILFEQTGKIISSASRELHQSYPKSGWVEHDAVEIATAQIEVTREALQKAKLNPGDITAAGITSQRETTVVWERSSGKPIHPAIVWQDRRTAEHCRRLKQSGAEEEIRERTGLLLDPYFSATKVAWILEHCQGARAAAERGELAFGTVDSWLIWNLTAGKQHVTDTTNASRTSLFNVRENAWDPFLLELFGIPESLMPGVLDSSADFGTMRVDGLDGIPICAVAGDQHAALFGQACFTPGMAKNTYGTGCFLLWQTGEEWVPSRHRLLTTPAWRIGEKTRFALEGSVFTGGAVVQWLRDGLGLIASAEEVEPLAESVPDSGGVLLVPAFSGLGAPYWDPHARGTILGITRGTTAGHIARAALESIAFQTTELLQTMEKDTGSPLNELRVDGGACRNNLLLQFQADLLQVPVVRPQVTETTALGVANLAGLSVGVWDSLEALAGEWKLERTFYPSQDSDRTTTRMKEWQRAVERSRNWVQPCPE